MTQISVKQLIILFTGMLLCFFMSSQTAFAAKMKAAPDLVVTAIVLDPSCHLVVKIQNIGKGDIDPASFKGLTLGIKVNGKKKTVSVPTHDKRGKVRKPGSAVNIKTGLTITNASKIFAVIDAGRTVAESNEKNNEKTSQVTCKKKGSLSSVVVSAVKEQNNTVIVLLERKGKALLNPGRFKPARLEVSIGAVKKEWQLLKIDPLLRTLNRSRGHFSFNTGLTLLKLSKVSARLKGVQPETRVFKMLKPSAMKMGMTGKGSGRISAGIQNGIIFKNPRPRSVHTSGGELPAGFAFENPSLIRPFKLYLLRDGSRVTEFPDSMLPPPDQTEKFILKLPGNLQPKDTYQLEAIASGGLRGTSGPFVIKKKTVTTVKDKTVIGRAKDAGDEVLSGSYLQTCRNVQYDSSSQTLTAECSYSEYEHYRSTTLNETDRCSGDISNYYGALTCHKPGPPEPPPGSYRDSCIHPSISGSVLTAVCRVKAWAESSSIELEGCVGPINNIDGNLTCRRSGDVPYGSYLETCIDPYVRNDNLTAICSNIYGNNDKATLYRVDKCVEGGDIINHNGHLVCEHRDAPEGSYRDSCTHPHVHDGTLIAVCRKVDNTWKYTKLSNFSDCRDIVNNNGHLECSTNAPDVPAGSYLDSCDNAHMLGTTLSARCRGIGGTWQWTSLGRTNRCTNDISNFNGMLFCQHDDAPPGSYRDSCTSANLGGPGLSILYAICTTTSGSMISTALADYEGCTADISNNNGNLQCGFPAGSYSDSCDNIRLVGTRLSARCRTTSGTWQFTSLERHDRCTNDISNFNGHLFCQHDDAPPGSYRDSCTSANLGGPGLSTLRAICRTTSGSEVSTGLPDYESCTGDISNNNGNLTCPR